MRIRKLHPHNLRVRIRKLHPHNHSLGHDRHPLKHHLLRHLGHLLHHRHHHHLLKHDHSHHSHSHSHHHHVLKHDHGHHQHSHRQQPPPQPITVDDDPDDANHGDDGFEKVAPSWCSGEEAECFVSLRVRQQDKTIRFKPRAEHYSQHWLWDGSPADCDRCGKAFHHLGAMFQHLWHCCPEYRLESKLLERGYSMRPPSMQ